MTMDIATLGIRIDATETRQATTALDNLSAAGGRTATSMTNAERAAANLGVSVSGLNSVMGAFGVTLGLVGVVAFARELTKTVEQVQNLSIRLKGLTKDADDYAKVQDYLVDVSNRHHKSNLVLADSFSRLLTLEQTGLITRQQSMALLEGMSNASSKTGASTEQLKQSMFGLSQALGSGVLHMEELNQVTEPMPGLLNRIAEASGFTVGEFRKLVGEGRVTSEVFGKVMVGAFASYQGAAEAAGDTLTAKYADIGNSWTALAKAVEAPVVNTLSPILDLITSQIHGLAQDLRELNDFYTAIKTSAGYGVGGAPDNGMAIDLKGRANPPTQEDPAKDSAAAIRAEIEATAASTKAKKEHKAAISDEERASIALTKSFNDAIESLNLHNIELSKTPRELEEATLKSKGYTDAMVKQAMAIYDIGTALEAKKKLNETEKTELQALTDQYNKLTLSAHDYYATTLSTKGIPAADQGPLVAQFDKNAGLETAKKASDDAKSSLDAYNKSLDSANVKTSDLGKVTSAIFDGALGGIHLMAGAFDTMVNSISANTKALEENAKMQKLNDQETDPAKKAANVSKYAKEEAKLNNDNIKAQLTGAAQIAGAAASMFDKKSAAAKAFHAIEITLSVARLAMDAVEMASTIGKTIANVSAGAAAMFRDMGPLGFAGVAAMLAVMAGLGFAASGGGSSSSPAVVESATTGTVLGDTAAQSDSVNKTNQLLKDIQSQNYPVLQSINNGISGMAAGISTAADHLYNLNTGVSSARINTGSGNTGSLAAGLGLGIGSAVIQGVLATGALGVAAAGFATAGITTALTAIGAGGLGASISGAAGGVAAGALGASAGLAAGALIGGIGIVLSGLIFGIGSLLGVGKTKVTQTGGGLVTEQARLGSVINGSSVNATDYATGNIKTTGWFSDSNKSFTVIGDLNKKATEAFTSVFKNAGESLTGLAVILGGDVKQKVADYVIPAMTIDLYGLNAADAGKKLSATISTTIDTIAESVFSDAVGQYQKAGEGLYETAVRIALGIVIVKDALSSSSITLVDNVIAVSDALVTAAGGLKEFQAQFATYFDKFYSDTEKQTKLQTQLSSQLGSVGESLATSREGYRKQVEAIDITTAAGQAQYSMLLKLSAAADTYYTGVEAAASAAEKAVAAAAAAVAAILKTNIGLTQQLTVLTGKQTQTELDRFNALAAVSDESTKTIMQLVYAQQDLNAANTAALTTAKAATTSAMAVLTASVAAERKVITDAYTLSVAAQQKTIDTITASVSKLASISATLKSTLNGMIAPNSEAISRANAQATISSSLILAKTGGIGKIDEAALNNALGVVSKPSEALFSTFTDYQRDFLSTSIDIADLSKLAGDQLGSGNAQLDAAKATLTTLQDFQASEMLRLDNIISSAQAQINAINGTTTAVMTISAALAALALALGTQTLAQAPAQTLKEGLTSTGYQSSGGASLDKSAGIITFKDASSMSQSGVIDYVNTALAAGHPELVYSQALAKGVSAQSLDALMGWTAGTSNAWATKNGLPKFAGGGLHDGGWRMVGENGPELENTGPSRIFSHSQSKSMLNNDDLIAEIKALREEVRAGQAAIANNTRQTTKILRDVTQDGTSITTSVAV